MREGYSRIKSIEEGRRSSNFPVLSVKIFLFDNKKFPLGFQGQITIYEVAYICSVLATIHIIISK